MPNKNLGRLVSSIIFCLITFLYLQWSYGLPMVLSAGPDNNQGVLLTALEKAQKEIFINVYELNSLIITRAIIEKIQRGVLVHILVEGQPVGGYQQVSRTAQNYLVKNMKKTGKPHHFLIMTSINGAPRRFRFDHVKYTIIDGRHVVLGSENYSDSGHASKGSFGNRGWEIVVESPALARKLIASFKNDSNPKNGDIINATAALTDEEYLRMLSTLINQAIIPPYPDFPESPRRRQSVFYEAGPRHNTPPQSTDGEIIMHPRSPDTSLAGLRAVLRRARRSLDIELMSFNTVWNGVESSPLFGELVAAAQRGVAIRLLLNDDTVFSRGEQTGSINLRTAKQFLAATKGLNTQARIGKIEKMNITYIHNKGIIVDGTEVLISSINWTQNSIKNNREEALLIRSPHTGGYYTRLFNIDWQASR